MVYQFDPGCPCCFDCFYMWYYSGTVPVPDKDSESILWKSNLGRWFAVMDSAGDVYTSWRDDESGAAGIYVRKLSGVDGSLLWEVQTSNRYSPPTFMKVFGSFLYVAQRQGTSQQTTLFQIDLNGNIINQIGSSGYGFHHLTADSEGYLYLGDSGTARKLSPNLETIWTFTTYPNVFPSAYDSSIVFLPHSVSGGQGGVTVRIYNQDDIIALNEGTYTGNPWVQIGAATFPFGSPRFATCPDSDHCIIGGPSLGAVPDPTLMMVNKGNDVWPYEEGEDERPFIVWQNDTAGPVDRMSLIGENPADFLAIHSEGSYLSRVNSSGVEWVSGYWQGVTGAGSNGSNTVIVGNPGSSIQPGCP